MKCVCGYEHETVWLPKQKYVKIIKGDEEFKEIEGTFLMDEGDYFHKRTVQVGIYACPKCGTLKITI